MERSEGCWKKFFLNSIVQALVVVVVVVVVVVFIVVVLLSPPPFFSLAFSLLWCAELSGEQGGGYLGGS